MFRLPLLFNCLLVSTLTTSLHAAAQDSEPVLNRAFQVTYAVPPPWTVTRQRTDSVDVLSYHNPADGRRLWVGQLRGRHAVLPPARALQRLLRHLGATEHAQHLASAQGLDFLESTGTCRVGGRELRYDARVSSHPGQVRLVRLHTSPAGFNTQAPLLHGVLEGFAPLRGK